jgi:hypothetical protein
MATLQVKRVPDELYERIRERATAQGISISEYVVRTLERNLALPSMSAWLADVGATRATLPHIDTLKYVHDARDEIENG